jgi:hypothetical protein
MSGHHPATFAAIGPWAGANGATVAEGRVRFAQGAVLRAIAGSRALNQALVFKGGQRARFRLVSQS